MVTGDHPITAKALARQSGLFTENSQTVEDIAAERHVPIDKVSSRLVFICNHLACCNLFVSE